jgi:hypothetical protein
VLLLRKLRGPLKQSTYQREEAYIDQLGYWVKLTSWASAAIKRTEGSEAYIDQLGYWVKLTSWASAAIKRTEGSEAYIDQIRLLGQAARLLLRELLDAGGSGGFFLRELLAFREGLV